MLVATLENYKHVIKKGTIACLLALESEECQCDIIMFDEINNKNSLHCKSLIDSSICGVEFPYFDNYPNTMFILNDDELEQLMLLYKFDMLDNESIKSILMLLNNGI